MLRQIARRTRGALKQVQAIGVTGTVAYNWRRAFGSRNPMVVRVGGVPILVRPGTPDLTVARHCLVEPTEFSQLPRILPMLFHNLIIDAGGYIGTAAIYFARTYPYAKVLTIEPSSANFAILRENIRPYPNITAIHGALLAEQRPVALYDRGTGGWGFTVVPDPLDRKVTLTDKTNAVTIADILEMSGKDGIDVLKLDIEGAEKEVLDSSADWLSKTILIYVETHDRIIEGCSEAFENANKRTGRRELASRSGKRISVATTREASSLPDPPGHS